MIHDADALMFPRGCGLRKVMRCQLKRLIVLKPSQLVNFAFGCPYVAHQSFLLCTILMHFGLQETHLIGCFLGANVAGYYRSVGVLLGSES